eukprot:c6973_g1_i1.p1 GENE.c6973_g1_i1~~c6973_g1_i1.p1  ORF type:complete len:258 (-),score=54.53 c6973_g1_i1:35-808(-)
MEEEGPHQELRRKVDLAVRESDTQLKQLQTQLEKLNAPPHKKSNDPNRESKLQEEIARISELIGVTFTSATNTRFDDYRQYNLLGHAGDVRFQIQFSVPHTTLAVINLRINTPQNLKHELAQVEAWARKHNDIRQFLKAVAMLAEVRRRRCKVFELLKEKCGDRVMLAHGTRNSWSAKLLCNEALNVTLLWTIKTNASGATNESVRFLPSLPEGVSSALSSISSVKSINESFHRVAATKGVERGVEITCRVLLGVQD